MTTATTTRNFVVNHSDDHVSLLREDKVYTVRNDTSRGWDLYDNEFLHLCSVLSANAQDAEVALDEEQFALFLEAVDRYNVALANEEQPEEKPADKVIVPAKKEWSEQESEDWVETMGPETLCFFHYDIPTPKEEEENPENFVYARVPSPCDWLWEHGAVRLSKSAWQMTLATLRRLSKLIDSFDDANKEATREAAEQGRRVRLITWGMFPFAKQGYNDLKKAARHEIGKELTRLHGQLIKNIDKADRKLASVMQKDEVSEKEQTAASKARKQTVKQYLKKASQRLQDAVKCAVIYDESEHLEDLIQGIAEAVASQINAFNASVAQQVK